MRGFLTVNAERNQLIFMTEEKKENIPAEAPKEAPKAETPKEAPKTEAPKTEEPKAEQAGAKGGEEKKAEGKPATEALAGKKKEKPANCAACNKSIKKKRYYYRDGKHYCTKRCWKTTVKKEEKAAESQNPSDAKDPAPSAS
jgi:hypothetical protein